MSKALRASVLVLLLAGSARAGWMPNGSPEPAPSAPSAVQEGSKNNAGGDIQNGSPDGLTEIVLSLLSGLSSLF